MSTTVGGSGRLGNQIFRNIAVSLIAEKHDLFVSYDWNESVKRLGIDLFVGTKRYNKTLNLTDVNYFSMLNSNVSSNLNATCGYFQASEISNYIYNYLRSNPIQKKIMVINPFRNRYNANNDVFIHIRLGDIEHLNVGVEYYLKALSMISSYDNLYI